MKNILTVLFTIILITACTEEKKLTFDKKTITSESCEDCAKVTISVPEAINAPVKDDINDLITGFVIQVLNYTEEHNSETIEEEVKEFESEYNSTKKEFPDMSAVWEAKIEGKLSYQSENLISLQFDSYVYTGGAHGYSALSFINIDAITGKELGTEDLFSDFEGFKAYVENKFRKDHEIPANENINSTGFMFNNDVFHLPQNIGFSEQGILLIYNPYDIAAYSEGMIQIEIPYAEANPYLKPFDQDL